MNIEGLTMPRIRSDDDTSQRSGYIISLSFESAKLRETIYVEPAASSDSLKGRSARGDKAPANTRPAARWDDKADANCCRCAIAIRMSAEAVRFGLHYFLLKGAELG